jgi:hypothetical protein
MGYSEEMMGLEHDDPDTVEIGYRVLEILAWARYKH